jgi:RecA-family ATPase
LIVEPCADRDISLCSLVNGALISTPMLKELREQIGDYQVGLVFLDSVARLFGGNENDRHQVTQFVAWLTWALQPTDAAICLLGHPAKATGSEFSGSTAWEASVRARLYFGFKLPDQPDDELEPDTDQRWLAKRKTNYSTKDTREVRWADGCMQPANAYDGPKKTDRSLNYLADETLQVFRQLKRMGFDSGAAKGANYLPALAKRNNLLNGSLTERDLKNGLAELLKDGRLTQGIVGLYANRSPRKGLIEASGDPF